MDYRNISLQRKLEAVLLEFQSGEAQVIAKQIGTYMLKDMPMRIDFLFSETIGNNQNLSYYGARACYSVDGKYDIEIKAIKRLDNPLSVDIIIGIEVPKRNPILDSTLEITAAENGFEFVQDNESMLFSLPENFISSKGTDWCEKAINYIQESANLIELIYSTLVPQQ